MREEIKTQEAVASEAVQPEAGELSAEALGEVTGGYIQGNSRNNFEADARNITSQTDLVLIDPAAMIGFNSISQ
jgi:hypothetical protein